MRRAIKFRDYRCLNEAQRASALRELAEGARALPNGELTLLDARIRGYEARYEMTSEQMREGVASGRVNETSEIASWLIALDVQRRLRADVART